MDTLRELFVRSLNMAVAASWLVLALLLLRPLLKKFAPKWVLCALWVLVAVRLVCPVMLHSNLSAYRLAGDAVQEDGQVVYFRSYSDTGHTVVGCPIPHYPMRRAKRKPRFRRRKRPPATGTSPREIYPSCGPWAWELCWPVPLWAM